MLLPAEIVSLTWLKMASICLLPDLFKRSIFVERKSAAEIKPCQVAKLEPEY